MSFLKSRLVSVQCGLTPGSRLDDFLVSHSSVWPIFTLSKLPEVTTAEGKENGKRLPIVLGVVLITGKSPVHWFLGTLGKVVQGSVMCRTYKRFVGQSLDFILLFF